ncbi:MAG: serine--tRNA ligase, partial [Candidatus Woesearchaeota archaeon]|nr:serine--tRNA ligase [Candidatus Woesearchaeota archaeon]
NVTEYQSRGLSIRHGAQREFCHTLNSTLVATSRALVAILENFQQADGSVKIPKALHKYTGFKVMKKKE